MSGNVLNNNNNNNNKLDSVTPHCSSFWRRIKSTVDLISFYFIVCLQIVQLLKEQLYQRSIVAAQSTTLPQSSKITGDMATGLERTSADIHNTAGSRELTVVTDLDQLIEEPQNAALDRSAGSRLVGARPPLLHSASLPSQHGQDTSLSDMSPSSSVATVLLDRMSSLEHRVAEQQRKSEADMARLFNQVRFRVFVLLMESS